MNIEKHLPELRRAVRNGHYEPTESGVLFPRVGLYTGFSCETTVNGKDPQLTHNLLTLEGRRYLLRSALSLGQAVLSEMWIAPFTNDVTVQESWTAATFHTSANEYEDYTSATRVKWDKAAHPTASSASNTAVPADFTLATGQADVTIRGFGLLTNSGKRSGQGVLISAQRHNRPGLGEDDVIGVRMTLEYRNVT